MMPGIVILVGILMIVGILGSALPFIPGQPLILVGALIYAVATGFDPVDGWRLAILAALAILAYVLDHLSAAFGARKLGGSRWAMAGAILGGLAGLFFGPVGILMGPIVGAVAFELLNRREMAAGLKSGFGTVVGMFFGVIAKLSLAVIMVGLFSYWAFRG